MATEWISPTWRMPEESNQSKFENYSLDFDGSNEINFDNNIFSGLTNFSFAGFYNIATIASDGALFGSYSTGTNQILFYYDAPLGWRLLFDNGSLRVINTGFTTTINEWHFIAGSFNNTTGELIVYYNNDTFTTTVTTGTITSSTFDWSIGADGGSTTKNFEGKLTQLSFYDYALSPTQIGYLRNLNNPMAISGKAPIAYYPLGGSSTGSASTLTIPNESVPSATVFSYDDDKIDIPQISLTNNNTISIWAKRDDVSGADDRMMLLGSVDQYGYGCYFLENSTIYLKGSTGGAVAFSNTAIQTALTRHDWVHWVFVKDSSSGTLAIYVDGDLAQSQSSAGGMDTLNTIGNRGDGGNINQYCWHGEISNTQAWDTNLSASEITTLYNNGVPYTGTQPQAANLKGWWKMNVDTSTWNGSDWIIGDSATSYTTAFNFDNILTTPAPSFDSSFNPDGYTKLTFSIWAYAENYYNRSTFFATFEDTVNKYSDSNFKITPSRNRFNISINGDAICALNIGSGFQSITPNDVWNCITLVYDGTFTDADTATQNAGRLKFYTNGVYKAFDTFTNNVPSSIVSDSLGSRIGAANPTLSNGSSRSPFFGKLSNLQIWDTNLSASDALALYNNGSPISGTQPEAANLKAWWKMDTDTSNWNGSTWSVTDSSGEGNTATSLGMSESNLINSSVSALNGISSGMTTANLVNSDLTRSIPYSSYSMVFDGIDDFISIYDGAAGSGPSSLKFTSTDSFSISCWINMVSSSGQENIISFRGTPLIWLYRSGTTIGFRLRGDSSGTESVITTTTTNGAWHNIVAIRDYNSGSPQLKLYIDNVAVTPVTDSTSGNFDSYDKFSICNDNYSGGRYWFDGNTSNVAIFNSALTEDQILTIYNGSVPNDISSLSPVAWWSLAGDSYYNGNDWICPDLGSGGNNGTSDGMGGTELVGNGPGSTANGIATSMNIPENLQGNAPNSSKNAFSVNMNPADRVEDVPA